MPRPPRPRRDFSGKDGNPTNALQNAYQQLMVLQDPDELMDAAIQIVQPLVGKGMSELNYQKFMQNIQGAARKGVAGLQGFLTNYILAGSGMSTGESKVSAIASMLTEDVNNIHILTPYQQSLKTLVESNTNFNVCLVLEGEGEYVSDGQTLNAQIRGIGESVNR